MKFKLPNDSGKRRGFTLIELMIAITLVAILSTMGIIAYGQTQKIARDSRRKQDLQKIKVALDLYYQDNKAYPATGGWVYSYTGGWLTTPLTSNYISGLPKDPLNTCSSGNVWSTTTCYTYAYTDNPGAAGTGICPSGTNQYYALVTNLENTSDPETPPTKSHKHCTNNDISTIDSFYAIVSTQ